MTQNRAAASDSGSRPASLHSLRPESLALPAVPLRGSSQLPRRPESLALAGLPSLASHWNAAPVTQARRRSRRSGPAVPRRSSCPSFTSHFGATAPLGAMARPIHSSHPPRPKVTWHLPRPESESLAPARHPSHSQRLAVTRRGPSHSPRHISSAAAGRHSPRPKSHAAARSHSRRLLDLPNLKFPSSQVTRRGPPLLRPTSPPPLVAPTASDRSLLL